MKSKNNNKDSILFILSIPLLLFLAFYISTKMEDKLPNYSVVNKAKMGYSVFYESLSKLNYPVEKALKPVNDYETNNVQIIPSGGEFDINKEEVKQWVENGGMLVYLSPETTNKIKYGTEVESKGNISIYKYHKGVIINADADSIANGTLIKDTDKAYELLKQISGLSYEKIYFNESYFYSSNSKKSLWGVVPMEIKYIIYQMIIVLCAFFYYKGKRFGKIIPLYEEVERSGNEYLYSVASLYRQAKCWDLMAFNYYKNFLKGFIGNEEDWLEHWETEKIPSLHQARRVYEFMKCKKAKPKAKEYIQIITRIEYLNKILEKRRDLHWKTLKKTLRVKL